MWNDDIYYTMGTGGIIITGHLNFFGVLHFVKKVVHSLIVMFSGLCVDLYGGSGRLFLPNLVGNNG